MTADRGHVPAFLHRPDPLADIIGTRPTIRTELYPIPTACAEPVLVAWCDWRGCRCPADWVLALGTIEPDSARVTHERRPLCTRHADATAASWHTATRRDLMRPTITQRFRVTAYAAS